MNIFTSVSHMVMNIFTSISHEGRGQENIPHNGGHLALEGLTAGFPSLLFIIQTLQQGNTPLHLNEKKRQMSNTSPIRSTLITHIK